jgi:hypothetical protein
LLRYPVDHCPDLGEGTRPPVADKRLIQQQQKQVLTRRNFSGPLGGAIFGFRFDGRRAPCRTPAVAGTRRYRDCSRSRPRGRQPR